MLLMSVKLYFFNLLPLTSLLLFAECGKKETMEPQNATEYTTHDSQGLRYLALGDSYTKAECELPANSYPSLLVNKFKEAGIKVQSQTTIAQTGWRTDNLKNAIDNAALQDTFDLVSLLIGVNNQYQGRSAQEYRTEFKDLLATAIRMAKGRKDKVFVLSIPDYGVTPFGSSHEAYISSQIDLFNAINKEETEALGVEYFDITPISRKAKTDSSLNCTDQLHPSAKMYAQWVNLMLPDVLSIIRNP